MPIEAAELARRLRTARAACGLTQEEIADRLGVSRPTLAQIEAGHRAVTSLELDRLAYFYGRDIRELLAESFQESDSLVALFRRHPEMEHPGATLEALRHCISLGREINSLEWLLGLDRSAPALPAYPLRPPSNKWDAVQQGERIAAEERHRLDLGGGPLPNLVELLDSQGVRAAQVDLPNDVSGLTLSGTEIGLLVVVNRQHAHLRRRFSLGHEYCHALLDRDQQGLVSRASERESLLEVRANAFAAALLMPPEEVSEFLAGLAKGAPSRQRAEVYDEENVIAAQARPEPGSQRVQIYDVVLLAHHFGVSRQSALFRLKNLKLVPEPELEALRVLEDGGTGRKVARILGFRDPDEPRERNEFRHRFLALGFEALRRGKISRGKLHELGGLLGTAPQDIDDALEAAGIDDPDDAPDVLLGQV